MQNFIITLKNKKKEGITNKNLTSRTLVWDSLQESHKIFWSAEAETSINCSSLRFPLSSRVFPPLKSCGGFELLISDEKSRRNLRVVKYGSCCADEIRCLGTGRIYIRPIQTDIALGDDDGSDEECEKCFICKVSIPLRQMRDHMELCPVCYVFRID